MKLDGRVGSLIQHFAPWRMVSYTLRHRFSLSMQISKSGHDFGFDIAIGGMPVVQWWCDGGTSVGWWRRCGEGGPGVVGGGGLWWWWTVVVVMTIVAVLAVVISM